MKNLLFAIFTLSLTFILPASAFAQNVDLTVSPVFFDFSPHPGEVLKDKVRVHNNTSTPLQLTITIDSMGVNDRGDVVPQALPSTENSNWFSFTANKITVPANEWLDVPYTISVPQNAAFGNYFAITFAPAVTKTPGSNALVQGNIVVPVLLNVQKEGSIATASIESFQVGSFVNEFLPVDFAVSVKNTGNIHLSPRGNIFIRGSGDKDLAILEINSAKSNILPNSARAFTSKWSDGFLVREPVLENGVAKLNNRGEPLTKIVINWNKLTNFRIGKYTAYVLLAYDDGKRDVPIDATTTFWVFPYTAVIIGVGLVLLVLIGGSAGLKVMVKREAKKLRSQ